MNVDELEPNTLLDRLLDPSFRTKLLATIAAEQGSRLPVTNAYERAAAHASGSPDQFRTIIETLFVEDADDELLRGLAGNSAVPEDLLLRLCEEGRCISELGHRPGPRVLLDRLIELHDYAEAILTVGLQLYRDETVSAEELESFLASHADHEWLLDTLANATPSDPAKAVELDAVLARHEGQPPTSP